MGGREQEKEEQTKEATQTMLREEEGVACNALCHTKDLFPARQIREYVQTAHKRQSIHPRL
jgi:hypothetical protein